MESNNQEEKNANMRDYLRVIFRQKATIITTVVTLMIAVFLGLQLKTPTYEAKVKMLILAKKQVDSHYYKDIIDFRSGEVMTLTQSGIVKSAPVIERVVKKLGLNEPAEQYEKQFCTPFKSMVLEIISKASERKLAKFSKEEREQIIFQATVQGLDKRIKVEPVKDSDLFNIAVTDFSPANAVKIANMVSRSYCLFDLEQQLAELEQKYGEKHLFVMQLKNNIEKMQDSLTGEALPNIEAIGPASVKIIEQAAVPIEPKGLSNILILLIAFFMSLPLGIILAFSFDSMDPTFKSPQDLKEFLNMPLLEFIPKKNSLILSFLTVLRNALSIFLGIEGCLLFLRILAGWLDLDAAGLIIKFIYSNTDFMVNFAKSILPFRLESRIDIHALIFLFFIITFNFFARKALLLLNKIFSKNTGLIAQEKVKPDPYNQAYKKLAEQVFLTMKGNSQKSVAIVSVLPQEGNTTVVANLGRILADCAGHKVLLIDANLRKPTLHEVFKIKNQAGLTEVFDAQLKLSEALQEVSPNLSILAAGKHAPEPMNILSSAKMLDILKEAEKNFELIFIDCADLNHYKDAIALSGNIDGFILLVSEGRTRREVLKTAISPLQEKRVNLLGAILNNRTFYIPKFIYERA